MSEEKDDVRIVDLNDPKIEMRQGLVYLLGTDGEPIMITSAASAVRLASAFLAAGIKGLDYMKQRDNETNPGPNVN